MKHTETIEDARYSFAEMNSSLQNHFNNINQEEVSEIKLANEYYKWTTLKTNLILNEKNFQIPFSALPNTIKFSSFQWLHANKQSVISQYYQYDKSTDKYIISVKKKIVPRWANVTRITQINLSRVHFEKFGDVKPNVLKEIGKKLASCGII